MLQMLMDKIRGAGRLFSDERRRESDVEKPSRRSALRRYRAALPVVCKLLLVAVLLSAFPAHAQTIPYTMTWHEVSGNCTLYPDETFTGTLTPTAQANVYTTVFIGGATVTLTVPGSNTFTFSFPEAGGMATDNMQLTFDAQSHSITGSDNWTHTHGCMGYGTLSGSWTPAASTPTTAIVASGQWNVVTYYPYCNYTELGTFNLAYANGAYSVTGYTSNRLSVDPSGNCQNIGPASVACVGFYLSGKDLLSTSQFQAMMVAYARSCRSDQRSQNIQSVNFTSPDSVSVTLIDPEPFGSFSVQMARAASTPTSYALAVAKSGTGSGTVTSTPAGIDCGASCSAGFSSGAAVSLTATPATGSYFAGWRGDCSGSGSCSVTMNTTRKVIATFKPKPFIANTTTSITATNATIATTIDFNAADVGKHGSVFITGWVPLSGLGALGIQAALSKAMRVTTTSDNPYLAGKVNSRQVALGTLLAAADPNAWVLVQKTPSGWALVVNGQLIPYVTGVLGAFSGTQNILYNTDPSALPGAQFCVGYGTSDSEMIVSGRMLPVAIIPVANPTSTTSGSCNVADIVVVEFYKADINHYFMTASTGEAVSLDNNASWNWVRTGKAFNVWLAQSSAPSNASPVCRFYGLFSNGTVGSHFYTVDPGECEYVKGRLDWGWGYEGDAFYAVQPTGGSCPSGTSPVYRAYNNGMGGAPNHRYMTNQTDVDTMVSQGWVSEGTAFCGVQ